MVASHGGWVRLWSSFAFVFALVLSAPTYAQANHASDPAPALRGGAPLTPPAAYSSLIDDALREYELLHFEEARALFARAHALYPNARTLRGLGMVEFELRHYADSAELLRQALAAKERALDADLRASTTQLLERARGFVGQLRIAVQPPRARVRVDGQPIADLAKPIALDVGDHEVDATADGFAREQRKVTVRGGESQELLLELAPEAVAAEAVQVEHDSTPRSARPDSGPGALPWVLVGVGGAMMIGGGVLVALAQSDVNQVEDAEKGTRWSESAGAYDASPLESGAGFALLGVGAAGLAGGLVWALQGGSEAEHARNGEPRVLLGMSRISLNGTF